MAKAKTKWPFPVKDAINNREEPAPKKKAEPKKQYMAVQDGGNAGSVEDTPEEAFESIDSDSEKWADMELFEVKPLSFEINSLVKIKK